jgi:hypothetical protein
MLVYDIKLEETEEQVDQKCLEVNSRNMWGSES